MPSELSVDAAAVDPDKAIRILRFFSYPKQMLYFLSSFIFLVSLCHFLSLIHTYATRRSFQQNNRTRGPVSLRRLPTALADVFRTIAFRTVIPVGSSHTLNLAEVFLTCAYIGTLLGWALANTTTTTGIHVEPHYFANRAGVIAASQLPIMTALGMRNNIFSLLTGVSFDKISYLHRASARSILVLTWLHAAGRLTIGLTDDGVITDRWVQCGVLAISTLTVLCFVTIRPIRERSYGMFLIIHALLASIFILSIYFHLQGRQLTYYGPWPSILLWGLDRFLRILRTIAFNLGYFTKTSTSKELDATVDILSPHFLRVTMYRQGYFHWLPGQSAFLNIPGVSSLPFESHPFTISTIDDGGGSLGKKLVFLVRVRNGFTRRLMDKASQKQTFKVLLDGPYSSPPLIVGFHTAVMIAGGSGVAFTLPIFLHILSQAKKSKTECQKVMFIWAIREAEQIQWISDALSSALKGLPAGIEVAVQICITTAAEDAHTWEDNASTSNDSEEKAGSEDSQIHILDSPLVSLRQGRPDLTELLEREMSTAAGPISINVCGTHALTKAVRAAISRPRFMAVLRGGPTVKLHIEAFGGS